MQEYWVNVYKNNEVGVKYRTREDAIRLNPHFKCLYRIHVKMKPKFAPRASRARQKWFAQME